MIKKHFLEILRWGLRFHGISHFIEVLSAIAEDAYITASIALIFIFIEILASFYIPKEHIHLKPYILHYIKQNYQVEIRLYVNNENLLQMKK